jgi:hypothetical protein
VNQTYPYTLWPSLYDRVHPTALEETWPEIVKRFSSHTAYRNKFDAPGFGPYRLVPPGKPCVRHGGLTVPHRCNGCVPAVTLAVFDVDRGAAAEVAACDDRLGLADIARLWFTTWSYRPFAERAAYRLVIPLTTPVPAEAWAFVRESILEHYQIPADVNTSSGVSHFYFGPSCPDPALGVISADGTKPLDVAALIAHAPKRLVEDLDDFLEEIDDAVPDGPVDLAPVRTAVERRIRGLARREPEKAEWLRRILAGEPIAEHGSRNASTMKACGALASAAPEASLAALRVLIRPSVDAMIAAGSVRVTHEAVDRWLASGLQHARARVARNKALVANMGSWAREAKARGLRRP